MVTLKQLQRSMAQVGEYVGKTVNKCDLQSATLYGLTSVRKSKETKKKKLLEALECFRLG